MTSALATSRTPDLSALLAEHGEILLYDGVCGLCDSSVQFILQHDRSRTMRFATLQGEIGQAAMAEFPALRDVDSVVLLQANGATTKSTAVLHVARYLGGLWRVVAAPGWLLPRAL
ncbi:MAG: DCC1-like thiol-disulfide oxidoreductase family protein, partial [Gemmatimonadaceae bacterium]